MSRPRKPFGANHPGRLPATMIKVLAAEMSDPQRLRRGKQYARDGAVLDIDVAPGVVTCEVQGSRPTPYLASLEVRPGDGMPLRRDVEAHCSCPDDDNWDGFACKHVIAAMFVFSDELLLEPDLLTTWRSPGDGGHLAGGPAARADVDVDVDEDDDEDGGEADDQDDGARPSLRRRHLRLVRSDEHPDEPAPDDEPVHADPIAAALRVPAGASVPELPQLDRFDPPEPSDPMLASAVHDALAHLRIEWD